MTPLPPQDESARLRSSYFRLRAALRDPTSGLFHYSVSFDEIRGLLRDRSRLGVIWVSLADQRLVETVYGWESYDRLIQSAAELLREMRGRIVPAESILASAGIHADGFVLFVPFDLNRGELDATTLLGIAYQIEVELGALLTSAARTAIPSSGGTRVGRAFLGDNPFQRFERLVHNAIEAARSQVDEPRKLEHSQWYGEILRVVRQRDVEAVFQPVVELESGEVQGLEAFARGPKLSAFRLPRVLFSVGADHGEALALDRLCHDVALESLIGSEPPALLFLNTTAEGLVDPYWSSSELEQLLARAGLSPTNIVLEVNEAALPGGAAALDDHAEQLELLRARGFQLSLDDLGGSAQSTQLVLKLRPTFLKLDLSLVRGLEHEQLRREMVRELVVLAQRVGARFIAERVETAEERQALLACGVTWGQGYLFGAETTRGARVEALGRGEVEP